MLFHVAAIWGITADRIGLPHSTSTVPDAVANVIKLLISLAGMFAVIMIIYGGLQFVAAAGSPTRAAKARETLLYASAGLVAVIAALAIVTFITSKIK